MAIVSVEYEYNLPNDFLVDHSFSEGKKRATTYDGPDKLYFIVEEDTGKEHYMPITAEEKADGRPLPLGCKYVEVDCIENPLFCQLRAPIVDEVEENHDADLTIPHSQSPEIEGYPQYMIQYPLLVRNIYDKFNSTPDKDGNPVIATYSVVHGLFGGPFDETGLPDWAYVREKRNGYLEACDSKIGSDMPQALKDKWLLYRQRLRDMTTALADVPPWIALKMFPISPEDERAAGTRSHII